MATVLRDFTARTLIQAIDANQSGLFALLAHLPGVEVSDRLEMLQICTGVPHFMVNGVFRTRLADADVEAQVAVAQEYFRARNLPLMWTVTPSTQPANLGEHLHAHGFSLLTTMPGMAVGLHNLPQSVPLPSDVTIREAINKDMLADWTRAASEGFAMPAEVVQVFASLSSVFGYGEPAPLRNFVAYRAGEPIGSSSLYLDGSVAGIYTVSVVPKARQQGIGAALTVAPLQIAKSLGYRVGVLLASVMGAPVYRRLGFEEHGEFTLYAGNMS